MEKKSTSWYFFQMLKNPSNLIIMLAAIFVTIAFVVRGIQDKSLLLALMGLVVFAGYIYTRIRLTIGFKKKVDEYLEKGFDFETATNLASQSGNNVL